MKMKKKQKLEREWDSLYILFKRDTLETYQDTVRKGNTETYSQFIEGIKKDWMKKKSGGDL